MARNRIAVLAFAALIAVPLVAVVWLSGEDAPPAVTTAQPRGQRDIPPAKAPEPPTDGLRLIEGKVENQDGEPVMGATARIAGQKTEGVSDRRGVFYLRSVPLEGFIISVDAVGFAQNQVEVPGGKAGDKTPVTITLIQADPVQGVVRNPMGNAQPKATVRCVDQEDEDPGLSVVTDMYGEYSLPPRAAGCEVQATHPLFGASEAQRVKKGKGNDLDLRPPAGISGTVVDENGDPIPGARVSVEQYFPTDGKPRKFVRARGKTDDDGTFTIESVPPGRFVLVASIEGRPPAKSDEITVADGEPVEGVRIASTPGGILYGTVTDAGGQPVEGVRVSVDRLSMTAPNTMRPATTDVDGRYELVGMPRGPFSIRTFKQGFTSRVLSAITTEARGESQLDIEIAEGDKTEFTGIGAVLIPRKGHIAVGLVVEDGPAARAGLQRYDRVLSIDGEDIEGWSVPMAVQTLRGDVGTNVRLVVERDGEEQTFVVTRGTFYR